MIVTPDPLLPEVLLVEPKVHEDARGLFQEIHQQARYAEAGIDAVFVQDNRSVSTRGVLRGMHFQHPRPQGKLVMAMSGVILDVAVDIRVGSPTFGRWCAYRLVAKQGRQVWIPPGFAHGFLVLSESADVLYKCTDLYDASCDQTLLWSDPALGIEWPLSDPVVSEKDRGAPTLQELRGSRSLPTYAGPLPSTPG
jgi:dTDP-4-dehydrorhamnose 3,5-epimerase